MSSFNHDAGRRSALSSRNEILRNFDRAEEPTQPDASQPWNSDDAYRSRAAAESSEHWGPQNNELSESWRAPSSTPRRGPSPFNLVPTIPPVREFTSEPSSRVQSPAVAIVPEVPEELELVEQQPAQIPVLNRSEATEQSVAQSSQERNVPRTPVQESTAPSQEPALSDNTATTQPSEVIAAQPSENLGAQPSENLGAQPSENFSTQPSENLAAQPSENLAAPFVVTQAVAQALESGAHESGGAGFNAALTGAQAGAQASTRATRNRKRLFWGLGIGAVVVIAIVAGAVAGAQKGSSSSSSSSSSDTSPPPFNPPATPTTTAPATPAGTALPFVSGTYSVQGAGSMVDGCAQVGINCDADNVAFAFPQGVEFMNDWDNQLTFKNYVAAGGSFYASDFGNNTYGYYTGDQTGPQPNHNTCPMSWNLGLKLQPTGAQPASSFTGIVDLWLNFNSTGDCTAKASACECTFPIQGQLITNN